MAKRIVRSVSLDALNISSQGFIVSDNWLQAVHRQHLLQCPHSLDGMPFKDRPMYCDHITHFFAKKFTSCKYQ